MTTMEKLEKEIDNYPEYLDKNKIKLLVSRAYICGLEKAIENMKEVYYKK
jgi:hypothetical protein